MNNKEMQQFIEKIKAKHIKTTKALEYAKEWNGRSWATSLEECHVPEEYCQNYWNYVFRIDDCIENQGRLYKISKRDSKYLWITWLSKLISGDSQCIFETWVKTHYTGFEKAITDSQLAIWIMSHNKKLSEFCQERLMCGDKLLKENQCNFKLEYPPQLTISGKPDLISINGEGKYKVYDIKTGIPHNRDISQVLLYMFFLGETSKYKNQPFDGCLIYNNSRQDLSNTCITNEFKDLINYWLNILSSNDIPKPMPNNNDCMYCNLNIDCLELHEYCQADVGISEFKSNGRS